MNDERGTPNDPHAIVTSGTYVKVVAVEAVIIALLYIFGRLFS